MRWEDLRLWPEPLEKVLRAVVEATISEAPLGAQTLFLSVAHGAGLKHDDGVGAAAAGE